MILAFITLVYLLLFYALPFHLLIIPSSPGLSARPSGQSALF